MSEGHSCPHCGQENDSGRRFCGSCGGALVLTCGTCGASNSLDAKFCGSCGADLRSSTEPQRSGEERRVITVLFADLVGFTSRAERLDPEDVRAILTPYYARLRDEIQGFGGTVEKFIGDAVMGVFGAPVAFGDDPERGVRAALRIRDAVGEMNEADPELDLQVRIAVNTGEAIVALGARTWEGEAMVAGDVVNTAARLQTAAQVDSVLVGEETYRCTRSTIEYEEVEPVAAKGKQVPVPAWRALAAEGPPGERADMGVAIVGREHELAALAGVWEHVLAHDHAHLATVFGPSGVGKSRLAYEFAKAVASSGGRTIRGRSLPYGESGPYGAFAQQIKQVAGIFDSDPPEIAWDKLKRSVAEVVESDDDEIASHISMLLGLSRDGDVADRHSLFFSARRLVEALATRQPTVLLFEDLHWADPSLLDLLELLASRIRDTPLFFLTLSRPDLLADRPSWGAGLPAYTALPLEPLSEEHSRELVGRLITRAAVDAASHTAAELAESGEGNPLFIEEMVASIAERAATNARELPTSIRGIVAARLDALPQGERALLLDASVMGRIFWSGALTRLGDHGDQLAELLDSLEARDLIRREPVSRLQGQQQFRFKHVTIRDVAYATLPRAKRRESHSLVADFLEEMTAESESPATLGHHWREAGERQRAIDHFVAAAEQASRGWAKAEAVRLYSEALQLIPEEDEERRRKIRIRRGVAQQMLFHVPDAESLGRGDPSRPAESPSESSG